MKKKIYERVEDSSLGEIETFLKNRTWIALDTETKRVGNSKVKFDIYDFELISIQIGDEQTQFVLSPDEIDLEMLDNLLVVGHNIKFDYQILKLYKNYELKRVYDTMLVEYILNTGLSREKGYYSLEETHYRYFGNNPYSNQLNLFAPWIPKSTRSNVKELTPELEYYGATDIETTSKVYLRQKSLIEDLLDVVDLENKFVLVLGDLELNGMPINIDRWIELDEWAGEQLETSLSVLRELHPEVENWNSSKQVIKLFKSLGINTTTKDNKDSVRELVIKDQDHPLIELYLKYKQLAKLKSTYGINFLKYVSDITNRVHSNFHQILNTGRTSSTSPNLQNIITSSDDFKEGIWWREAFEAPKGRTFVIADYSSQELGVLAHRSQDEVMLEALNKGKDLHAIAASALYQIPLEEVTKEQRKNGKITNFAIGYGAGADKISAQFGVSKKQGQKLIDNYFNLFVGVKEYQDKTFKETIANGYISIDILGRKSFLPYYDIYLLTKSKKLLNEYFRLNANFPIQGTAASMAKLAGVYLRERGLKLVLLEHDCWIIECDKKEAKEVAKIVEDCMQRAANYFCPSVKIKAEAIISNKWCK